ncbi:MAG: hypothetical protein LKK18_06730 [Clostridiales bacterium]|nr:hypothetical protein [Clostridiales bacterium]
MKSNKLSKLTVVLLTAAMVLAFMPAMTFSSHAASKKAKTSITRVAPTKAAKYTMTVGKASVKNCSQKVSIESPIMIRRPVVQGFL